MQVEEKPDVTYSDVGGCKEQIEKLREVVELPLLHVRSLISKHRIHSKIHLNSSPRNSFVWVLNHQKVFCSTDHQVPAKHFVHEQ